MIGTMNKMNHISTVEYIEMSIAGKYMIGNIDPAIKLLKLTTKQKTIAAKIKQKRALASLHAVSPFV